MRPISTPHTAYRSWLLAATIVAISSWLVTRVLLYCFLLHGMRTVSALTRSVDSSHVVTHWLSSHDARRQHYPGTSKFNVVLEYRQMKQEAVLGLVYGSWNCSLLHGERATILLAYEAARLLPLQLSYVRESESHDLCHHGCGFQSSNLGCYTYIEKVFSLMTLSVTVNCAVRDSSSLKNGPAPPAPGV